jgi:hypothetical protein
MRQSVMNVRDCASVSEQLKARLISSAGTRSWRTRQLSLADRSYEFAIWLTGASLLLVLSIVATENITVEEIACAGILLVVSIWTYLRWRKANQISIPVWALVCAVHFVSYGLPIFGSLRTSPSFFDRGMDLSDDVLVRAMVVGIVGLLSIAIGRAIGKWFARNWSTRDCFLQASVHTPFRIQALLLIGIAANLLGLPFFGTIAWNISVIALSSLPLAAFLWLTVSRGIRALPSGDFWLAVCFLLTRMISGARSYAALATVVAPLYLMGLAAIAAKQRLPWRMLALVTCVVIFLQPAKSTIRQEMSRGQVTSGLTDAIVRWVDLASSDWQKVYSGEKTIYEQLAPTESRSSLLTMTGLILDKTPDRVPFQHGAYYPLLLKNLVPRVLWPEKPSVNVANQFFQVNYGLTEREHLSSVSIACGFEAEGYMNFGWYGVVAIGILVGCILGVYEKIFFSIGGGRSAIAIGLALLPGFLMIESQLVQYVGGILQFAVAATIVFYQPKRKELSAVASNSARMSMLYNTFR